MISSVTLEPVAVVRSAYKQKFGIPHQPGMTESIISTVELLPSVSSAEAVRGLEQCSHIWLLFLFSATLEDGWKPTVRPPRLGGKTRLGVFATRSPHRPNPIGLSPVKLERIRVEGGKVLLEVSGADLLDGTPILDIKPYLPTSDCLPQARYDLPSSRERLPHLVSFSAAAERSCAEWAEKLKQPLRRQIEDVLKCDPRPAYKRENAERIYGIKLYDLNIRWRIDDDTIFVDSISDHWTPEQADDA